MRYRVRIEEAGTHGCRFHAFSEDDGTNQCRHPRCFNKKCDDVANGDCPLPRATAAQMAVFKELNAEYEADRRVRYDARDRERSKRTMTNCRRNGGPVSPDKVTDYLCNSCRYFVSKWNRR